MAVGVHVIDHDDRAGNTTAMPTQAVEVFCHGWPPGTRGRLPDRPTPYQQPATVHQPREVVGQLAAEAIERMSGGAGQVPR
jgi:hypothetical protein